MGKKKDKSPFVLNGTTGGLDYKVGKDLLVSYDGRIKYRAGNSVAIDVETGYPEMIFPFDDDDDDDDDDDYDDDDDDE